jgi:hypothetical protein
MDTHATRMGMGMGTILYPHMDMGFSWVQNILWWVWIWVGDTHWVQTHCENRFCRFAVAWVATSPIDFSLGLLSWFFAKLLCYLANSLCSGVHVWQLMRCCQNHFHTRRLRMVSSGRGRGQGMFAHPDMSHVYYVLISSINGVSSST